MSKLGLLLGANNDIVLVNGRLAWTTGASLVRQRWKIRAKKVKGEWVLDKNSGVPYFDEIFKKGVTKKRIREIFRKMSLETIGVVRVIDITIGELDPTTRVLQNIDVKALVTEEDGTVGLTTLKFYSDVFPGGFDDGNIYSPPIDTEEPVQVGVFRYVRRDGGPLWSDYAVFYGGPGITLTDGAHGITISGSGLTSLALEGGLPRTGDIVLYPKANIQLTEETSGFGIGVGDLNPEQLVFGGPSVGGGVMAQSDQLTWDGLELRVEGTLDMAENPIEQVTYIDWVADGVGPVERRQFWDDAEGFMVIGMKGGTVNLQVGGEQLVRGLNNSGDTLANGVGVSLVGYSEPFATLDKSDITMGYACSFVGLATESISNGNPGYVNTFGLVRGFDTTGLVVGEKTWLGTDATLQATQPQTGYASVMVGFPLYIHGTDGIFLNKTACIPFLSFLSDVNAREQTHTEGDVLAWDAVNGYWDLTTSVVSIEADGEPGGPISDVIKFYAGTNVYLSQTSDGIIINAISEETVVVPDSLTLVTGTYSSGNLASVQTAHDLDTYDIREVGGVPGFSLIFDFIDVENINRVRYYYNYSGSGAHVVEAQLYNYLTTVWDRVGSIVDTPGDFNYLDISVDDDTNYIDGSGNSRLRIYHITTGNPSHNLSTDYVALVKMGISGGLGPATLAESAVGFGSSINELTGDATNFTWDETNRVLKLGSGTPTYVGSVNDSIWVKGRLEVSSRSDLMQTVISGVTSFLEEALIVDNKAINFGSSSDVSLEYGTNQTLDALVLGVDNTSRGVIVCRKLDKGTNFDLAANTHPALTLMSSDSAAQPLRYGQIAYDGTDTFSIGASSESTSAVRLYHDLGTTTEYCQYDSDLYIKDGNLKFGLLWTSATQGTLEVLDETFATNVKLTFGDDFLDPHGSGMYARFADSAAEVTTFISNFGDVSVYEALDQAAGGGSGTLQTAYDGGGTITMAATKPVALTAGATTVTKLFTLTNNHTTSSVNVMEIVNQSESNYDIYFDGAAGDDTDSLGHQLFSDGAISMIANYPSDGYARFQATVRSSEGDILPYAVMKAYSSNTSTSAELELDASGLATLTSNGDDIILTSGSDNIELDPGTYVDFNSSQARSVLSVTHGTTLTVPSFVGSTLTVNWSTGTQIQEATISQNCTTVTMTAPPGAGSFTLNVYASGGNRTLTGFTNVTWYGDYDLDINPFTIVVSTGIKIGLDYISASAGYHAWVLGEV